MLLAILERQADELPSHPQQRVRVPFTEDDLHQEIVEHGAAVAALAEVALTRNIAATPFELSTLVLAHLDLASGKPVDQARACMIEDAVVVHGGGASMARLRRSDPWTVLFGTMDAITGLARLLANQLGGRGSTFVRLAFDVQLDELRSSPSPARQSFAKRPSRDNQPSTQRSMPTSALSQVEQWAGRCESRHDPDQVDPHDVRIVVQRRGLSITITEQLRALYPKNDQSNWLESRIAQLRWLPTHGAWSLHYADHRDRWHGVSGFERTADLAGLLALIDDDPLGQFWG